MPGGELPNPTQEEGIVKPALKLSWPRDDAVSWDEARMTARVAGIGQTLTDLFRRAEAEGITTAAAADRLATERIEAARG